MTATMQSFLSLKNPQPPPKSTYKTKVCNEAEMSTTSKFNPLNKDEVFETVYLSYTSSQIPSSTNGSNAPRDIPKETVIKEI